MVLRKEKLIYLILLSFVTLPGASLAQQGKSNSKVVDQLNLTKEQKKDIAESYRRHQQQVKAQQASVRRAQQALDKAVKNNASEDVINQRFEAVQREKQRLEKLKFTTSRKIQKRLTPKQRERYQRAYKKKKGGD